MRSSERAVIVAISATLLSWLIALLPAWQHIEWKIYDVFAASPIEPPNDVVVIAIDEPSMAEIGLQWPWPRSLHAELIDQLRRSGATLIAFDVIFAEPSTPLQDDALIAAMDRDVILAAEETVIASSHTVEHLRIEPFPALAATKAKTGVATVKLDADAVLRRMPVAVDAYAYKVAEAIGQTSTIPPGQLIRFFGPSRTYRTVSYYQALDPHHYLPPNIFDGKFVFIGLSLQNAVSAGSADMFATPFTATTGSFLPGVEVQATLFHNTVLNLSITPLAWPILLALTLFAAALTAMATANRIDGLSVFAVGGIAIGFVAITLIGFHFGQIWVPPTVPALAAMLAFTSHLGWHAITEARKRLAIHRAFSQYLSPDMVRKLADQPEALKLGGERRTLTILFMDVRGFTTLSETLRDHPEQLTAILNRLLTPVSEVVLHHGGTIDKYIGDCLMAFWNAPLDDPDHANHAVEAAIGMLAAVTKLNAEFATEGLPTIKVGIGINTGECVVGNMGSKHRFNYSAMGDCVNVAARLEGLCKTYDVPLIIGEETAAQCDRSLVELDRVVVRGRSALTAIYTLA